MSTTPAKLAEIDRVLACANNLLRLQGMKVVPCQWKIDAFLQGRILDTMSTSQDVGERVMESGYYWVRLGADPPIIAYYDDMRDMWTSFEWSTKAGRVVVLGDRLEPPVMIGDLIP